MLKEKRRVYQSSLKRITKEYDTYSWLNKFYSKKGYQFQRIEGCPSVPDIWIGRGNNFMWIEVKVYDGSKSIGQLTIKDIMPLCQPGQMRFRVESELKCPGHHVFMVFNRKGAFVTI